MANCLLDKVQSVLPEEQPRRAVHLDDKRGHTEDAVADCLLGAVPQLSSSLSAFDSSPGRFAVDPAELGSLAVLPPPNAHGSFSLTVTATATEASRPWRSAGSRVG